MDKQVPEIGNIVHYVLPGGSFANECRPAIVVKVWSDMQVNLQVFIDGTNDDPDYIGTGPVWVTSVPFDPSRVTGRSWHWQKHG